MKKRKSWLVVSISFSALFVYPFRLYNRFVNISAVIITFNEEKNIESAIRSVDWADEILVVDSESADRTQEIAESLGARVIVNAWPGFSAQKQFAVNKAVNDWIFSLDADERVTDALKKEILVLKESAEVADGYQIPRLSYYMGRAIRHGGWYPDRQLRLFDRRKGRWKDVLIHESVAMTEGAKIDALYADILHYSVENARHHSKMIAERYAPLGARQMFENGKTTSPFKIAFALWFAFIRTYFLKLGLLDGFPGFCIAYFAAHHAYLKHLMLWEMQNTKNKPDLAGE